MTSTSRSVFYEESQSISKPHYFNDEDDAIHSSQYLLAWDIIMDGPPIPLKQEGELLVPKSTNQVKKSKVGIFTLNYKTFKMKPEEDIKETKVTAIEEAKNLETLTLNELISSLLTYEMGLKEGVKEKVENKKVNIALKYTTIEYNDSSDYVDNDNEIVMFARRFKRFMKSNKRIRFQKEGLKLGSTKERNPMSAKSRDTPNSIVHNGRIRDQEKKSSRLTLLLGVTKILPMKMCMK
ncbi:zf-CCHC domain-containing protein/UBN2 domain-containing protein [Gossypium australe]|uniref:Zf-CCHC domain-containing protein/UBN2 domain-containing protein n=1 Tax=Gossypium australe TaxID=47621 RepID=A0A5B6X0T8_9ROSI|nr:zf-CCHC domain-containing protein/UBN2 domain-containing protein [Gossypium australe]